MKSRNLIAAVFVFFTLLSCKEEKKEEVAKVEEKPQTFDITLNMVVKQNDSFQLFYTDESTPSFDEKKSIWVEVKGAEAPQDIKFSLPKDELPTNFRVDLGQNKGQTAMKINSLSFSYFDKNKTLKSNEILSYFVIGETVIFNPQTGDLDFTKSDMNAYDPMLYPQDVLKEEILKLVK